MRERIMPTEDEEQTWLLSWAEINEYRWPELGLLYHIPNEGKRTAASGARLRRMGLRRGVPDLCLPAARGRYHGLYIELKAVGGRATAEQKEFIEALCEQGFFAVVCVGGEAAARMIVDYLEGRL